MVTCQHLLSALTVSFAVYVASLFLGCRGKPSAALSPAGLDGELPQPLLVVLVMVQGHLKESEGGNRLYCEAVVLLVIISPPKWEFSTFVGFLPFHKEKCMQFKGHLNSV